jgi:hypothetical protein
MQTPRHGVREVARYVWIESGGRPAHVSCVPEFGLKTHRPELLEAAANLAATIEFPPPVFATIPSMAKIRPLIVHGFLST